MITMITIEQASACHLKAEATYKFARIDAPEELGRPWVLRIVETPAGENHADTLEVEGSPNELASLLLSSEGERIEFDTSRIDRRTAAARLSALAHAGRPTTIRLSEQGNATVGGDMRGLMQVEYDFMNDAWSYELTYDNSASHSGAHGSIEDLIGDLRELEKTMRFDFNLRRLLASTLKQLTR